jgi:hypothetical protein
MLHNHSSAVKGIQLRYENEWNQESGNRILPFPPDTESFLYYYTPPEKPRIAAELRLRVTPSDKPASFESGSDLLKSDGRPWSRPLSVLSKYYKPLYEKLREDGLVPDDLHAILSTSTTKFPSYSRRQFLYTLNDTFIVDFSSSAHYFFVITEQGMEMLRFRKPFVENRGGRQINPYTGAFPNHHLSILLD